MQSNLFADTPQPSAFSAGQVQIEDSWEQVLASEFEQPYFRDIRQALLTDKHAGIQIYPPGSLIFNAFNTTPFHQVKVVILGQDPYHGYGQAHGLSFSVPDGVKPPPSLNNIYKEITQDLGLTLSGRGNLTPWAQQGVFLLNAILTVRAKSPASHAKIGWEQFTDAVIRTLSDQRQHLVFLLWGKFAQSKQTLIDADKHLILTAPHPSPYSASYGFFGCRHFSKTNAYLTANGMAPINWIV